MGVTSIEPASWAELHDLWGRLERMKTGIGGWIITAAAMPVGSLEARDAAARIYAATEEALEVRARIKELSSVPAQVPASLHMHPPAPTPVPVDVEDVEERPRPAPRPQDAPRLIAPTRPAGSWPMAPPGEITARLVQRLRDLPAHRADG